MTLSLAAVRARPARASRPPAQTTPIARFFAVWAERRALARMDATRLHDLGISPAQAATEAARPIWDLPQHRAG